jgi:hypothetical protein
VTNTLVSRERPYVRECGGAIPSAADDCTSTSRYRSFYSGHSTLSFASASLICSHHLNLELQGGAVDAAACATGYAVAATTALLRVMSDMHYTTDILTGAILGTAIGLGVPAIHYSRRAHTDAHASRPSIVLVPTASGLAIGGSFL